MNLNDVLSIAMLFGGCCLSPMLSHNLKKSVIYMIVLSTIIWGGCLFFEFTDIFWLGVGQLFGGGAFILMLPKEGKETVTEGVYTAKVQDNEGRYHYIQDIDKGVGIFGASGAGKSQSVIYSLLKHYAKWQFSGVLHDYKNFELSSVAKPLFEKYGIRFEVFAIHRPDISVRINPIAPNYIPSIEYVRNFVTNFTLNVLGSPKGDPIWRNAPEAILIAMIWRLKKNYPTLCNLPFIVAILLQVNKLHKSKSKSDFGYLVEFLSGDSETATIASTFLTAANEPKLLTNIYSSLTDVLQIINTPNTLYLLSQDEFNLKLNDYDTPTVLSVVNLQAIEKAITPINAAIIDMVTGLIDKKGTPMFAMIDEAPTIKINGLPSRVATLRSFGVSFGYCVQDLVQGKLQNDGKDYVLKSVSVNLSSLALGKVNDSETAKYYEGFFGYTDKEQYSYSKGDIFSRGDRRINKSYKEQRETRDYEFMQLQAGEFFMLSGGKNEKYRFKKEQMPTFDYESHHIRHCNQKYLNTFAETIYDLAAMFIQGGYKDDAVLNEINNQFKELND